MLLLDNLEDNEEDNRVSQGKPPQAGCLRKSEFKKKHSCHQPVTSLASEGGIGAGRGGSKTNYPLSKS